MIKTKLKKQFHRQVRQVKRKQETNGFLMKIKSSCFLGELGGENIFGGLTCL
jgi:hypothetical protein